jgi:chromosome segregation ATPase
VNEINQKLKLSEDRADAVEAKLLETVAVVKSMEEKHDLELQEAKASAIAAGTSQANEALQEAQQKAKEFSERAAASEQQLIRLQDDLDLERSKSREATHQLGEEQKNSALILEKFNRLGELSKKLKEQVGVLTSDKEQVEQQLEAAKATAEKSTSLQTTINELKSKLEKANQEIGESKKALEESEIQKQRLTSGS